jgi:hypothetical protein
MQIVVRLAYISFEILFEFKIHTYNTWTVARDSGQREKSQDNRIQGIIRDKVNTGQDNESQSNKSQ